MRARARRGSSAMPSAGAPEEPWGRSPLRGVTDPHRAVALYLRRTEISFSPVGRALRSSRLARAFDRNASDGADP